MTKEVKIVARLKNGEILKGFANWNGLRKLKENKPLLLKLAYPENTLETYIHNDQVEGLYMVKTFEGTKPAFLLRCYYDTKKIINDNISLITASLIITTLSVLGLVILL